MLKKIEDIRLMIVLDECFSFLFLYDPILL